MINYSFSSQRHVLCSHTITQKIGNTMVCHLTFKGFQIFTGKTMIKCQFSFNDSWFGQEMTAIQSTSMIL